MRRVEQIMGTPITIDIPNVKDDKPFQAAFRRFREIDAKYSTYKPDSEVSQFAAEKITEEKLSGDLKAVIKACRQAEQMTDGFFSAWATGTFDPSGYVKGCAIAKAGEVIEKLGYKTYCIAAGGDILAHSDSQKIWNIGIQDPTDAKRILNTLSISNGAVATSGNYERGAHIINPKTQKPAKELLSVTIIGPDIIMADILATAVFASGQSNPSFLSKYKDYKALIVKSK